MLLHFFVSTAQAACAAPAICPDPVTASGSLDPTATLVNVFNAVLNIMLLLAGILSVIYIVYSGIQYITSAGSPDKVKVARAGIINAVIGIIIVVAAYGIIKLSVSLGHFVNTAVTSKVVPGSGTSGGAGTVTTGGGGGTVTTGGGGTGSSGSGGTEDVPATGGSGGTSSGGIPGLGGDGGSTADN